MNTILKTGITLFLICALSSGLCGIVNSITAPLIAANVEKETLEARQVVSGGYGIGAEIESDDPLIASIMELTDGGERVGFELELLGSGYGGEFTIIASYLLDGTLLEAKMMANGETPGLGKKAEESWYMDMFKGKGGDTPLPGNKNDLDDPSLVSGASVTFNGVSNALRYGSEFVRNFKEV